MKLIQLTQGRFAQVDDEDFELINQYKWYLTGGNKYAGRWYNNKTMYMHRELLNFPDQRIDHIDRNSLNNQRNNLRICTGSQNCMNREKILQNRSSQYKGVHYYWKNQHWRAGICINYKKIHLGCFKTEIEAAKAYNQAAIQYFGEFAHLNIFT